MEVEFLRHKVDVLQRIQLGKDKSPKGCIDAPIVDLVYCINKLSSYVTTSSCSGRISLFAATHKHGFGAQDKGVKWLVASHSLVTAQQIEEALWDAMEREERYSWISLKFEPFVMHTECADFDAAKKLLTIALNCGFRESGIVIGKRVVLAIRSTALVMDCPLVCNGELTVRKEAVGTLVSEANTRFMSNVHRVEQLFRAIKEEFAWAVPTCAVAGPESVQVLQRWGLSLATESNHSAWVFGGYGNTDGRVQRNADVHHVTASTGNHDTTIHRVSTSTDVAPSGRVFASACYLNGGVLLFGGRHSPEVALHDLWRFDTTELSFEECKCDGETASPRWGHTMNEIDENTVLVFGGRDSTSVSSDAYILTTANGSYRWASVVANGPSPPPRFFHAATSASCGVLIHGGLAALDSVYPLRDMWLFNNERRAWEEIKVDVGIPRFAHTISSMGGRTFAVVGGSGQTQDGQNSCFPQLCVLVDVHQVHDTEGLRWNATRRRSEAAMPEIPSEQLALLQHHTVWAHGSSLLTLGGGLPCLGYSPAFCPAISIRVAESAVAAVGDTLPSATTAPETDQHQKIGNTLAATESCVVIAPVNLVKKLKVLLENAQLLDKSKRIADAQCESTTVHVLHVNTGHIDEVDEFAAWMEESTDAAWTASPKLKALPVTTDSPGFVDKVTSGLSEQLLQQGFQFVCISSQRAPVSKALQVSHHVHAFELLNQLRKLHGLDGEVAKDLPRKFELVGDVLMIPEDSLTGEWDVCGLELWRSLAACFEVRRVARKAIVDSGPKRESKVRLLLPPVGRPATTGPDSPGWVTLKENGIRFSFDITRIMFCSGNNTERIRMGKVPAKGETVVDLYCGVGYYTLPLLVHAQASLVHACEWNENSVLALRNNLLINHVADRCIVHEGDNRETAPRIGAIADRVMLGLLPSSEDGWPLALQCLKETGGMIHIHANILDAERDSWLETTLETFRRLARDAGRTYQSMDFTHIERVKSYAPYVGHYVADLRCSTELPETEAHN